MGGALFGHTLCDSGMLRVCFLNNPQSSFLLDQQKTAFALSKLSWDHGWVSLGQLWSHPIHLSNLSFLVSTDTWGENPPSLVG